jgi:TonB family protein
MFEKLVESTNEKEIKKQSAYLGLTTVFYSVLVLGMFVWSVFSFDLSDSNRNSDLTLEALVAPAAEIEPEPPQPRVNLQPKKDAPKNTNQNFDLLRNPVENIKTSTKPPDGINAEKVAFDEIRANMPYKAGNVTKYGGEPGEGIRTGISNPPVLETTKTKPDALEIDVPPPPVIKKAEVPREEKKQTVVTKGVINGIAVRLPKPPYPPPAKAVSASGAVNVQVMIDEQGNVISAVATSGHPLLRAAAVNAAKQAKFTPTRLSDQPVKVTGMIVYNFVP